jgi:hypothetical protein
MNRIAAFPYLCAEDLVEDATGIAELVVRFNVFSSVSC